MLTGNILIETQTSLEEFLETSFKYEYFREFLERNASQDPNTKIPQKIHIRN